MPLTFLLNGVILQSNILSMIGQLMTGKPMIQRGHDVNQIATQFAWRFGSLAAIGAFSAVHKLLDLYLLYHKGNDAALHNLQQHGSLHRFGFAYWDILLACADKSREDYCNSLQALLLTQEEALVWMQRFQKALAAR
jgi:hypothetical protein